jgi:hypothetical protein
MMESMRLHLLLAFGIVLSQASLARAAARGDGVFQTDFNAPNALKGWTASGNGKFSLVRGRNGSQAVLIERPSAAGNGAFMLRFPLPIEPMRGARVRCCAMIKAEEVAKPANPWNGVKCMLVIEAPSGRKYLQHSDLFGNFDWQAVQFLAAVPKDATSAYISIGLEATTGRAWFDDLKITIANPPRPVRVATTQPAWKGHDEPRLRGTMISPNIDAEGLRVLGQEWKANLIRWQLVRHGKAGQVNKPEEYDPWLEQELKKLDTALPLCKQYGLRVVIDLHSPPGGSFISGGYMAANAELFTSKAAQAKFLEVWDRIARRYKDSPVVWGYDLVNEPVEDSLADGVMDWQDLATAAAKRVRAIDANHAIIVEPGPWGSPEGLDHFEPIPVPGVVYSVHMYQPHQFTHQGVRGSPTGISYPGVINGKMWDKEALRAVLRPAIDFQRDYNVQIYIGEFSAIRWAPGHSARDYLRDCIDIFEENGWDWTYHAFREWNGWSVEHTSDPKDNAPSKTPTEREQLLRSWFAKNGK